MRQPRLAKTFKTPKPVSSRRHPSLIQLHQAGVLLYQQSRKEEVKEIAARMIEMDENFAPAWDLLACAFGIESPVESELAARRALALDSSLESAAINVGAALMKQRKFQEAAVHLGGAVQTFPNSAVLWQRLAGALSSLRSINQAEHCYRKSIELDPDNPQAHLELANMLWSMARADDAQKELEAAQYSGNAILGLRRAQLSTPVPDNEEQINAERKHFASEIVRLAKVVKPVEELPASATVTNFFLAYHGLNDRPLQEGWAQLLLKICPSLDRPVPKRHRVRASTDRIRLGVISSHLKEWHTISKLTVGLMKQLPADRFEVIAFDLSNSADPGYLPMYAEKVVSCSSQCAPAVDEIARAELDIAFYPDIGMHALSYHMAFARVAAVQCCTWGHPVTTGIPNVDYFISSDLIEPEGAEAHYSEELVRLSTLPAHFYKPNRTNRKPNFPDDWHVYLCPQTLFKFHPKFDATFADILRRDPAGHLVLIDNGGEYANKLGDRLSARHPDIIDRVHFIDRMPMDELFGLMANCHAMLDTWPFSGGNTNYEAFAFSTPVVTLPGEYMRGRVTYGQYRMMGFTDLVASSPEDYVEKALRLGNDTDYRVWARGEILSRSHLLYEDPVAPRELAAFFERACHDKGLAK